MKKSQSNYTLYLVVMISALCGLLFGFDTGIISGASIFIRQSFYISSTGTEVIVSSVLLGAVMGSVISGRINDRFGRRNMMLQASLLFMVGTVLSAAAPQMWYLAGGRLIIGLAIGIACYTAPLYIAEVAPADNRGGLVILNTMMVTGGIVVAYLVSILLAKHGHWRWMLGLGIVPAALLLVGVLLLPNSPRWLIEQGQYERALGVLDYLRSSQTLAEQEWRSIIRSVSEQVKVSWKDLFLKQTRWLLLLGCGLAVIQQVTGINTILYYAPSIFARAGFQSIHAQLFATLGMGMTNFLMTIFAGRLSDRVGRRPLLLWGLGIMTFCLFMVSFIFYTGLAFHGARWLLLVALIAFVASYAVSIGCLFWLLIAEIYPANMRGLAMSLAASCNWFANFIVAATFLTLLDHVGPGFSFLIYAVISTASVVFCYSLVPETRGLSLEEIAAGLKGKRLLARSKS